VRPADVHRGEGEGAIALLWRSGLRCGEALALRQCDINRAEGTVRVLNGKGQKARTVGVDEGALTLVDQWVAHKRQCGLSNGKLFCTHT